MLSFKTGLKITAAVLIARAAFAQDIIRPGQPTRGLAPERLTALNNGYIVTFAPGTPKAARALVALQAGAQVRRNYDNVDAIAITAPNSNSVNALRSNPAVRRVTPDWMHHGRVKPGSGGGGGTATVLPLDTLQMVSYEVQRIGIPQTDSDGTGIGVALLDSGIDFAHPDLVPALSATSYNAFTPGASCQDDGGHGTHLAGLIAAQNNSIAIVGVAPGARLYCVKVLDSTISGADSIIMAGLDWVLQNHATVSPNIRVVNVSFGRPLDSAGGETLDNSALRPLFQSLYNAGIVVVAAAGNDPDVEISQIVPAGFPEVLAVASSVATGGIRTCLFAGVLDAPNIPADTASSFTTDGAGVTTSAPGEERNDIVLLGDNCVALLYGTLSTTLNTQGATRKLVPGLQEARGTSFSTPLVTGVVARVMQKQLVPATPNGHQVEGIRTWIKNNASLKGTAPLDNPWGGVIIDYSFDGVREGIAQAPN